jgi:hypothetical protein
MRDPLKLIKTLKYHAERKAEAGFEGEAETFANKARQLMLEHQISEADLEEKDQSIVGQEVYSIHHMFSKNESIWGEQLLMGLISYLDLQILRYANSGIRRKKYAGGKNTIDDFIIIGDDQQREVLKYCYEQSVNKLRAACNLAARQWSKDNPGGNVNKYKRSFLLAAQQAFTSKLESEKSKEIHSFVKMENDKGITVPSLLAIRKQVSKVQEYMETLSYRTGTSRKTSLSHIGTQDGHIAGKNTTLNEGLAAGGSSPKLLN